MFRRYVNTKSNHILIVDENYIEKSVRVINMLKIPKNYETVLDESIEYIQDKIFKLEEIEDYIFILNDDLTSNLKGLFVFYSGSLPLYMYDEVLGMCFYDSEERKEFEKNVIDILEDDMEECLKKKIYPHQFLVKETYQGIVLYDPEMPPYKNRWQLVEEIKIA